MYNPILDTFIAVADCGSFTKAAERLFISSTAVMKQMNALEKTLDLKLLNRTPTGITLTGVGKMIYKDAQFMVDYSRKALADARAYQENSNRTFCVGTSLLNPARPFMDLWYRLNSDFSNYKLHLVSFDDNHNDILHVIKNLGESFDFLIGVCDSRAWLSLCNFLPLGRYKKMIAVSRDHRLASKKLLSIKDLYDETLLMVKRGDSVINDFLRNELEKHHPRIHIEDAPCFYDLSVFSKCAESNKMLLSLECWQDVHPGLVTIPVEWEYAIPYGLLYSLDPPEDVKRFVEMVKALSLL
ncbi:MAG: LysR family transcriptional regulator [bacterium]|nr:LysR family transcriptional regulator [bacterium]